MAAHEKDDKDPLLSQFDYPLKSSGYVILAEIGRGAFARVYRAKCATDHTKDVAIKIMNLEKHDGIFQFIRNEIGIMSKIKHPNLVEMYCSFVEGTSLWVVMPLHRGGSCCHIMKTLEPFGFKDENVVATIIREALKGLRYLHSGGHIHRDIKADNILMSEHGDIQLCDFGVAGALIQNGSRGKAVNVVGTPCWMAPEVVDHADGYDDRADIWSLGITAMELAFGMAPYEDKTRDAVMKKIVEDEPPTPTTAYAHLPGRQHKVSKELIDFVAQCLQKDATKRPTAATLSTHKWFRRAQDSKYIVENVIGRLPKEYLGASTSQINTVNMSYYRIPIRPSTGRPINPDSVVHRERQESWDFTYAPSEKEDKKPMSLKTLAWSDKPRAGSTAQGEGAFDHAGSRIESQTKDEDFPSTASEILVRNVFEDEDDDRARGHGAREIATPKKDASVLIEGLLHKKSPKNVFSRHVWQKRYFIVKVDRPKRHITLLYFKQEPKGDISEGSALGHVPLEEVRQVTIAAGKPGRFNLAIRSRTRGQQRLLELRSESLMEAQRWTTTLSKYIKAIWDDRRNMKQKTRKVVVHSEVQEVLKMMKAGMTFFKYNELPSSKAGQESTTEKLVVEVYWKEEEHSKGGKLFAAEPRDRERQSMLRLGAAPTSAPTASVISPTLITTSTSLPLSVDALPIESITEILIGKNTNALLNPIASSAPDVCCVSVLGHTQWNLQADSQEILQAFLFGIETLVKKCGKKIIRSETESSVLRVIDRRHMSMPVDVSNLDLGATVSDSKRGREEEYALVALENKFTNKIRLVHSGRVLVRQGPLILKKSYTESKYEFFLFNDLLLYAGYVNYRFKLKKTFPIGREFQVVDLQDDPKRKNQFWIVAAEKTLLIQAKSASEKQMWLEDLQRCVYHKIVSKPKTEEKHEELLARQREQDMQSLRQRSERKMVDQSAFTSATEVPKDYVPEEQMKISRAPSGRRIQGGPSLRNLGTSSESSSSSTSSSSSSVSTGATSTTTTSNSVLSASTASLPSSASASDSMSISTSSPSKPTSTDTASPEHSPRAGRKPPSNPSSAIPSPTSSAPPTFSFSVDTSPSKQAPGSPKSPNSGRLATLSTSRSVNSSPEKSPAHSPTSRDSSVAFALAPPKDVHDWLSGMSSAFVQYVPAFKDNGMSLDFLCNGQVTEQDLIAVGVTTPLHRKRILYEIDQEKIRRYKEEHDDESPASETEEPEEIIQSHVPVMTVEEPGDSHTDGLITPPPPPETRELPPPPPEDGGKVYPPPPG